MEMLKVIRALEYGRKDGLFEEGKNPAKWEEIGRSLKYREMVDEISEEGKRYLAEPINSIPFSVYRLFDQTGSRQEYGSMYFSRRGRLRTFALLYLLYKKEEHLEALEDAIWAICDEYTWCLPAHLGGNSLTIIKRNNAGAEVKGILSGMPRDHHREVDLFAAETGFALCEVIYLLEHRLSALVVYRARTLVRERILEPYWEINSPFFWETVTHNWSAVCGGSVGAISLYLIDDEAMLASQLQRILGTLEYFLSGYKDDGACTEGMGYWNYGFGFYVYFAELLRQRTGGLINLMASEKVRQIALFQQKCYLSGNRVVSFSDGFQISNFKIGLTCYLKKQFDELEIPDLKYREKYSEDHCCRWAPGIRDLLWGDPEKSSSELSGITHYLKDSQWFISRKKIKDRICCFAAKAGNNGEPHNHNDVGSFILHANGDTLIADLGCGEYTKEYFGPERYSFLCNNSGGHSLPIVEGFLQKGGSKYRGEVKKVAISDGMDEFALDISGAYGNENLQSLTRSFVFEKDGSGKLTLDDSFIFRKKPEAIVERFVTFVRPEVTNEGLTVRGERGAVIVEFDIGLVSCEIKEEEFINHSARSQGVYLIDLSCREERLDVETKIKIVFSLTGF